MDESANAGGRRVGFPSRTPGSGRRTTGILLIAIGAALLLAQLQMVSLDPLRRWWPLIVIGIGVIRLFGGPRQRWGGYWFIVAGIYGAIGEWRLFGLTWAEAWPIFIIAAGVGILIRPRFAPEGARRPG